MHTFKANDGVELAYTDTGLPEQSSGSYDKPLLILVLDPPLIYGLGTANIYQLHGFTGSSAVWQRNVPAFTDKYRVIIPDLRGHGASGKAKHGYHVSRLAADLRSLLEMFAAQKGLESADELKARAIGGSLGCSILWCYAELYTTKAFTHMIFVDQSPLQNSDLNGWDSRYCNRGMNSAPAVANLQATLAMSPKTAHKGTIAACLAYRSHPLPTDNVSDETTASDEQFFLAEAMKGNSEWYGKLMADHTSLDWRDSIAHNFGRHNPVIVLVMASARSGCFPAEGPLAVVDLVNEASEIKLAEGIKVTDGGHWCYWESPDLFNSRCIEFLGKTSL